jgi:LacI family transcriptional regulator
MRPTLADVAQEARVSAATVDRVMNARPGVSARTRAGVMAAAQRLGYLAPEDPGLTGALERPVRIAALLPSGTNAFIAELARHLEAQSLALPGVAVRIEWIDGLDGLALAARMEALSGTVDGIAVVAVDHPAPREAIRVLAASGTRVVTVASDIPATPRLAYVGIDNGQAGRLAGYVTGRLLGRNARGNVALFAGTLAYRGHQEREMGFRQILAEEFPALEIVELRESLEDRDTAQAETAVLLGKHPDLAAIYNAGGATVGIARALADRGAAGRVIFVAHDLTSGNRGLLIDGTLDAVIDQDAASEAREAVLALVSAARGQDHRVAAPRLGLILRENLPGD